jgi:oligopeptide transport system permease protein
MTAEAVTTAQARGSPAGLAQATLWKDAWRRFRRNRLAMTGLIVFAFFVVVAIISVFWTPYGMYQEGLGSFTQGLTLKHPLGFDSLGRDELSLIMLGARPTLEVGVFTAVVCSAVGVILGLIAGYFRGWIDTLISGIIQICFGIPNLLVAFLILFITNRPSISGVVIALSVTGWMNMARMVRGQTMSLRERDYVLGARAAGTRDRKIIVRHILPNALGPIIVNATFLIPQAILFEAFLSFLGLGLPAPDPSWGALVANGLNDRFITYTTMLFPSLALLITLMAVNFIGDGLRDALDPRMKR